MLKEFSARLQKGDNKGAWTCVVWDGSVEFFGTKGLSDAVQVRLCVVGDHSVVDLNCFGCCDTIGDGPASLWVYRDNPRASAFYVHHDFIPDGDERVDSEGILEIRMVRR